MEWETLFLIVNLKRITEHGKGATLFKGCGWTIEQKRGNAWKHAPPYLSAIPCADHVDAVIASGSHPLDFFLSPSRIRNGDLGISRDFADTHKHIHFFANRLVQG